MPLLDNDNAATGTDSGYAPISGSVSPPPPAGAVAGYMGADGKFIPMSVFGYMGADGRFVAAPPPAPVHMQSLASPAAIASNLELFDDPMPCACASFWCCNVCCGGASMYYAFEANSLARVGQRDPAKEYALRSRSWAQTAMITGAITFTVLLFYYLVTRGK